MKFTILSATSVSLLFMMESYSAMDSKAFAADLEKEAEKAERIRRWNENKKKEKYEHELVQEGGIPTTFCNNGKRHTVNKKPWAKIYTCPDCTIWNWPNARDWLATESKTYGFETVKTDSKTEPYILFYNINTVACLDKDADVSKFNSLNDIGEKVETYEQHSEWTVNRDMAMQQDMFKFGDNKYGPDEMNKIVQERGFSKDPELIKKYAKDQKEYDEFKEQDTKRRDTTKQLVEDANQRKFAKEKTENEADTSKFSITRLSSGDGDTKPTSGTKIKAHYTGTLLDGTKFDSSVDRGTPFEFTLGVGQVIKCWDMGFAELVKGQKAILNCPADVAYGSRGAGGKIPPNATLKFEV